ncbi:MAG: tellurite resistance TerB family protein [Myxococcales bacterium]|nr:tellurite resistance TerB family protein [Myxococcales bacterium]
MNEARRQARSNALASAISPDLAPDLASDTQSARLHALLEVAYLTAAADDHLHDKEIDHLVANLQTWLQARLEPAFLVELFDHLGKQLAADGFQARLKAVASQLDAGTRRLAYKLACLTALCDYEVHDDELKILGGIADAFGIVPNDAQATFDELDAMISSI